MSGNVLFLFVDALAASYVFDTPSLMPKLCDALSTGAVSKYVPLMGYSQATKASIFTGQPPSVHDVYGKFRFDFHHAPLRNLERVPFRSLFDRTPLLRYPVNLMLSKMLGVTTQNAPLAALPYIRWHELEDPYNYKRIGGAVTVFSDVEDAGKRFTFVGYPRNPTDDEALRYARSSISQYDLTVAYLSGLDMYGHRYPPGHPLLVEKLKEYDRRLYELWRMAEDQNMKIMIFSDHGMSRVNSEFDIVSSLKDKNLRLGYDYAAIVDSTMFRAVPFRNSNLIVDTLRSTEEGRVLSNSERRNYGLDFGSKDHGEIFFVLEEGTVFAPGFFDVFGNIPAGMHGYDPSLPSQLGVFFSNREGFHASPTVDFRTVHAELQACLGLARNE